MNTRYQRLAIPLFLLLFGSWGCQEPGATNPLESRTMSTPGLSKAAAHHLVEYTCSRTQLDAAVQSVGGVVEAAYAQIGVAKVSGLNDQSAGQLRNVAGIQFVTRDEATQWVPDFSSAMTVFSVDGPGTAGRLPSDATYFANQWWLRAIKAPEAWTITMGSSDIRVGILDSGISPTHVDLEGKYDLGVCINLSPSNPSDPSDYIDRFWHGTYVSGLVSTNCIGQACVAPLVRLVGIKVLGDDGWAPWANILAGILYAADVAHCEIINLSLGGTSPAPHNNRLISMMQKTINYARSKGVLVVSSAGNKSMDLDHMSGQFVFPAMAAGSMAVSATGPLGGVDYDRIACYTNYGRSVISVAAPGGNYVCETGRLLAPLDAVGGCLAPAVAQRQGYANPNRWYVRGTGTSASAPFVSGTAALVMSVKGNMNPGFVQARIESTADDLGTPGTDPYYGKGRLNAYEAVR